MNECILFILDLHIAFFFTHLNIAFWFYLDPKFVWEKEKIENDEKPAVTHFQSFLCILSMQAFNNFNLAFSTFSFFISPSFICTLHTFILIDVPGTVEHSRFFIVHIYHFKYIYQPIFL